MRRFFFTFIVTLLLLHMTVAGKTVDVLPAAGSFNGLKEEIIRVLSQNNSGSENLTILELVRASGNHSGLANDEELWRVGSPDVHSTNPFYGDYGEQIDRESRRLLQVVPAYDPGAGPVSADCQRDAQIFHRELEKFTLWALKMYDSTAKMPSGLLSGNVNQFGDYDECIGVETTQGIRGQYCLAYLQLDADESRVDLKHIHRLMHSHYAFKSNLSDPGHRVPRFSTVNWAVCTPASCSARDVEVSLKHILAKHTARTGLKIKVQVDPEMCQVRRTEPLSWDTIIVSLFFLGVVALSVVAAFYDHHNVPTSELLLSFSLKRNINKLVSLERGEGDIATLHGVRAMNAIMLVIAHKSMALFFNPFVNRTAVTEHLGKPWTVIGRAASLYTDPFIMLSGLLTTYSFVGRLNRTGKLDVKNEYLSRILRLVPTLGALILFCTYIMPFIGSGPQWNLVVTHHADICKKTWWRNFLFIHNYFGFENMCLTHTHHLGIDTQLFAFSPVMVLLLWKRPKMGAVLLSIAAILSTVLRYHVTYHKQLNNYVFFGTSIRQLFDTANFSYILPMHRLTVYIMGVFAGYLLRSCPKDIKINKTCMKIGWFVSTAMFIGAFFGPAQMGAINYVYNPTHAATYNAFAPIGWCTLFIWVAFLSHTGNTNGWLSKVLAWRGFLICTRLSYAIYLTQFPVFFYNVGRTRTAEYYEFFKMMINVHEFFWIIITSAILTLLFDTPFQNIKNYLLKKPKSVQPANKSKAE